MNRLIKIFFIADALIFSFVVPFTSMYSYRMRGIESAIRAEEERAKRNADELAAIDAKRTAELAERAAVKKKLVKKAVTLVSAAPVPVSAAVARSILPTIAVCESGNDPEARNKTSSAKGLLQIIDGTWAAFRCQGNVLNADDNFACGMKIATQSGLHHWNESKYCWSKAVDNQQVAENR